MAVTFIRYIFALVSWLLALGAFVMLIRSSDSGQAGAFALISAALIANGALIIRR